jgi:hypothetical protein
MLGFVLRAKKVPFSIFLIAKLLRVGCVPFFGTVGVIGMWGEGVITNAS